MIRTLLKGLRGTDWEMLTDFVSPVFFEIVPTLGMVNVFASIAKDYANKSEFTRARDVVGSALSSGHLLAMPMSIKLADHFEAPAIDLETMTPEEKKRHGEFILQIYFAQLYATDTTILDVRSTSFGANQTWVPKAIYYRWNKEFRSGICELYRGFYHNDPALFESGLKRLNLSHAGELFKAHFGEGSQDAVTFSLQHFKKSFHAIFLSCKEHRSKLHPDFFALGVYLVCLYEHLEKIDIPLDVRSAFNRAVPS